MVKRAILYFISIALLIPIAMWFAFGPGIGRPLALLLWPGERLLHMFDPAAGSNPSFDLLVLAVVSSLIWFCASLLIDLGLVNVSRRIRQSAN